MEELNNKVGNKKREDPNFNCKVADVTPCQRRMYKPPKPTLRPAAALPGVTTRARPESWDVFEKSEKYEVSDRMVVGELNTF